MKVYLTERLRPNLTNARWRAGFIHPKGYKFNLDGVSDWPDDAFTKKRIREGDIVLTDPQAQAQAQTRSPESPEAQAPEAQSEQQQTATSERSTRRTRSE